VARSDSDFVAAGVALVQERGFEHLTSRNLGEAMGVHSTAIYRHFPQWDLLVLSVTDALFGEAVARDGAAIASIEDPRARVLALCALVRHEVRSQPNLADNLMQIAAAPISVATPNLDALSRGVLTSLQQMGLAGSTLLTAYQALEDLIVGSLASGYAGHPRHLDNRLGRRRLVGVAEVTEQVQSTDDVDRINDEAFWFGANAILDACERFAAQP
jgi:AcrR family transcriptional regulator